MDWISAGGKVRRVAARGLQCEGFLVKHCGDVVRRGTIGLIKPRCSFMEILSSEDWS